MRKLLLLLVIALVITGYSNKYIVKDPARPQGLYIVGPDISTDSTNLVILYYSDNDGYTLTERNVFDWMGTRYNDLSADASEDILYMTTRGFRLYISYNGGREWILQHHDIPSPGMSSGFNIGYIVLDCAYTSTNFGESWVSPLYNGWYGTSIGTQIAGFSLGQGFVTNSDGILFKTENYFDSLFVINEFEEHVILFRGSEDGEIYARQGLTIYYSSDYGESFTETGVHPIDGGLEFVAGDVSGEIFAAGVYINLIMGEVKGGHIEIWRSTDYGATWDFIRDHHAAIEEHQNITCTSESFYTQTGNIVTSNENIMLFDIQGKFISEGRYFNMINYQNGIFIISNGEKSSKILNIK